MRNHVIESTVNGGKARVDDSLDVRHQDFAMEAKEVVEAERFRHDFMLHLEGLFAPGFYLVWT